MIQKDYIVGKAWFFFSGMNNFGLVQ
jgi:hypothetical protein